MIQQSGYNLQVIRNTRGFNCWGCGSIYINYASNYPCEYFR